MKIELKSIKYAAFSSEETSCYQANLYVDGKKIGSVSNEGHGGCDNFYGDREAFDRADKWCRANLPKWKLDCGANPDEEHETDLEMHCATLLQNHLIKQDYQRTVRKKLLIVYPDKQGVYQINHGGQVELTAAKLREQRPTAKVLNLLPLDEALTIYRAQVGG
ncbi:MAG: hypothetical protein MHM6MM_007287 [Cercozoa sp. M6MM]|jgi:hypothetical protein